MDNFSFGPEHYVPILKWKRAEQGALKTLREEQKVFISPLVQLVMPNYKLQNQTIDDVVEKFENEIHKIPNKIMEVWGDSPLFVDVSLLFTDILKVNSFSTLFREARILKINLIPVVYLDDVQEIKDIVRKIIAEDRRGMCLRLICADFTDYVKMEQNIKELLDYMGVKKEDVDLMIDIKETEDNDKYEKYFGLSQKINGLLEWRNYIFASGAFPQDLSGCKLDKDNLIPRFDWNTWIHQMNDTGVTRHPSFADYTIQHPIYTYSTQFYSPTCSIKYTLKKEWLIMKGERQKYNQYLASAAILARNANLFYGANFSDGDKYVQEKAKHFEAYIKDPSVKGTGSSETWIKAGINHHLACTVNQISNLS